jgi:hypothetical protein
LSRKFLTPVNLPHGPNLPAAGFTGDLFFKTTDNKVYTHDGTSWTAASSGGGGASVLSDLSDVEAVAPNSGDVLLFNQNTQTWVNTNLLDILSSFGLISADAGLYSTSSVTGTIDGGDPTTTYNFTYDGGNESSF